MDEQGKHEVDEVTLRPAVVISRRRPKLLWGVLAAMAVSAGALAVTAGGGDSAAPNLPISLGSAGGAGVAEARSMDASFAWITYVAGSDLPALGGEAPAYRLAGAVDEAQVRRLADALRLSGDVVHEGASWRVAAADGATLEVYEGSGASWWYSAASLDLPVRGGGSSSGSAEGPDATLVPTTAIECLPDTDCGVATGTVDAECPPAASCTAVPPDCAQLEAGGCPGEPPVPPADLPSQDEARAVALDVIAATGVAVTDAIVTVDGPYDAWYVTVEPRLDGAPSGLVASVSVGSKGVVTNASGFLGTPEVLGDYPILDTRAAIARLNEQMIAGGSFGGVAMGRDDVSTDSRVASSDGRSAVCVEASDAVTTVPCEDTAVAPPPELPPCKVQADGSEICEGSTEPGIVCPQIGAPEGQPLTDLEVIDCPTIDPGPGPAPEPMEIVLTSATYSFVLIPANDGSTDAYLVPGYRFTGENGEQVDAPAVADEALSTPITTEPPATVPDPGPAIDPTCETSVEEDGSGTTHTVQPSPECTVTDPVILEQGAEPQVGVGYYVEVDVVDGHCTWVAVEVGGQWWWQSLASGALAGWSTPTEGGTFTMVAPDRAEFVGDDLRTKVAELVPFQDGSARPLCD